ncbi:substrate binding domain-containing protein [Novosphingobium resinovorum]
MMIVPKLPGFFKQFPDISVEFVVSERYADLVQEGIDLAIRVGALDSSGLVARRIGSMQIATVASVEYLETHGCPLHPSDLDRHELVTNRYLGATSDWLFKNCEQQTLSPTARRLSCNSPADIHAAVLAGIGIAQSARGLFDPVLQSGKVVEVLADFVPDPFPIHALHASGRVPRRVRVVSDFIEQCLEKQPSLRLM